jgi:hypothetical protein
MTSFTKRFVPKQILEAQRGLRVEIKDVVDPKIHPLPPLSLSLCVSLTKDESLALRFQSEEHVVAN